MQQRAVALESAPEVGWTTQRMVVDVAKARSRRSTKKKKAMLLWERLPSARQGDDAKPHAGHAPGLPKRVPGDGRCTARTLSGRRCRGRVRAGSEFCAFHDPSGTAEVRRANAAKAAQARRAKPKLPKGYPRRLTTPEAACAALGQLYLETRAGLVTPQQAQVLMQILERMLQEWLGRPHKMKGPSRPAAAGDGRNGGLLEAQPMIPHPDMLAPPRRADIAIRQVSHN